MFLCFPPRGIEERGSDGFLAYWVKTAEFPGRNKMVQTGIPHLIPRGGNKKKLRKKKVVKGVLKKEKTVVRLIALC